MKTLGPPSTIVVVVAAFLVTACAVGTRARPTLTPSETTAVRTSTGVSTTLSPVPTRQPSTTVGASATTTAQPNGASAIEGILLAGPTCPVQRIDDPCPDRPLTTTIWVYEGTSERPVALGPGQPLIVMTGEDGRFRLQLEPGTYTLRGPCGGTMVCPSFPLIMPQTVTVSAGAFSTVTLHADTGIR